MFLHNSHDLASPHHLHMKDRQLPIFSMVMHDASYASFTGEYVHICATAGFVSGLRAIRRDSIFTGRSTCNPRRNAFHRCSITVSSTPRPEFGPIYFGQQYAWPAQAPSSAPFPRSQPPSPFLGRAQPHAPQLGLKPFNLSAVVA